MSIGDRALVWPSIRRRVALSGVGLMSLFTLLSCAAPPELAERLTPTSTALAIIGVGVDADLPGVVDGRSLTSELADFVQSRDGFSVLPAATVAQTLGEQNIQQMLERIATQEVLTERDVQRLMAAGLPAERALVVGVVSDRIRVLEPVAEALLDASGQLARNRYAIVQAIERETRLTAALVELGDGRIVWQRDFSVVPVTRSSVVRYHGNSLGASLVATLANTLVSRGELPASPTPPALQPSLQNLLREVAASLPAG